MEKKQRSSGRFVQKISLCVEGEREGVSKQYFYIKRRFKKKKKFFLNANIDEKTKVLS